jgi:hypothetical protein
MSKFEVIKNLQSSFSILLKDLESTPEELFFKSFGGKARTVADIVYELIEVNDHIGATIRNESPADWIHKGWITAPESFKTKESVITGLCDSRDRFVNGVEQMSEQDLDGKVITEHGEDTRASRCGFVVAHNWYHSGQINYIQTLHGDDGWNW